ALGDLQLSVPGGLGFLQLRGGGFAVGERVQELGDLAGVLAVDQVDACGADGVLYQLAVEDVDQAVDGEHPLPRGTGPGELFDVAPEREEGAAAEELLVLIGLVVIAPPDAPGALAALEDGAPIPTMRDDGVAAGTVDASRVSLGDEQDAVAAGVEREAD